jgi:hypothetical protein
MAKRVKITHHPAVVSTVLSALAMLAAFSWTFAASKTFDILVTAEAKWKKLLLVWGYALVIFVITIMVLWQCGDQAGDETTVDVECKKNG